TREAQRPARREPMWATSSFGMLDRFADEIEGLFDDFGFGRRWLEPRWGRDWMKTPQRSRLQMFTPEIEVYQENNEVVVRADLPGMKREYVSVDVTESEATISGERRQEKETEHGGVYRSERNYGTFRRTIPLPEGAIADQAKATFKSGVLEIRMPAP